MHKCKELLAKVKMTTGQKVAAIAAGVSAYGYSAFAEGGTTTSLAFSFDPAEMFTWTNTMLSALMPV